MFTSREDCQHGNVMYHYTGVSPYDGEFFQEHFECQDFGLTNEYPTPWKIKNLSPGYTGNGSFVITASNGESPMHGGTYSGDGDGYINLSYAQAKELVDTVNKSNVKK